jgi:hypothetical protein
VTRWSAASRFRVSQVPIQKRIRCPFEKPNESGAHSDTVPESTAAARWTQPLAPVTGVPVVLASQEVGKVSKDSEDHRYRDWDGAAATASTTRRQKSSGPSINVADQVSRRPTLPVSRACPRARLKHRATRALGLAPPTA